MVEIPFRRVQTPQEHVAAGFRESEKISLDSDSSLGFDRSVIGMRPRIRSPCKSNSRAPMRSKGPVEGLAHLKVVLPQEFFFDKMEGLSRAMFSSMDESWCR